MGATGVGNEGMYDYILFCACMRVSKKKKNTNYKNVIMKNRNTKFLEENVENHSMT